MKVNIIPDFVPDDYPLDRLPMTPTTITIHNTGNPAKGANAEMHGKFMRSPAGIAADATWHFTVDDKEIRQHLPLDVNAWHAGDGWNGPGNRTSIAIEICENGDMAKAEANAAALVAHLIETVPTLLPFPQVMKQHYDWSKKNCPRVIRARRGGWDGLLLAVQDNIRPPWQLPTVLVKLPGGVELWGRVEGKTAEVVLPGMTDPVPVRPVAEAMGRKVTWIQTPPTVVVE